jgi:hypothetical protein
MKRTKKILTEELIVTSIVPKEYWPEIWIKSKQKSQTPRQYIVEAIVNKLENDRG